MPNSYRHYRAPRGDGEVLCDPAWKDLPAVCQANHAVAAEGTISGHSLQAWRTVARNDLLDFAIKYSRAYRDHLPATTFEKSDVPPAILLAGHQPQMFHPGVWFKNFALDRLARATGAAPINLVIDNDAFRGAALQIPGGTVDDPHVESIAYDRAGNELPYEERTILDRDLAASFAGRVNETIGRLVAEPVIGKYWPLVMEAARSSDRWGMCLAQARHRIEERWGLSTLEVPLSRVCDGRAFRWFVCDLLVRLPSFVQSYNESLADYRQAHRLRSKAHPVPDLEVDGEWLEAPFWMWTSASPRRRRLFVRRNSGQLELTDRENWRHSIPGDEPFTTSLVAMEEWTRDGWKLRPRALTTTLYARMFLADVFLHGIGGGKYDQVTERISQSFYGRELPAAAVVTGTWRLPIARPPFSPEELPAIEEKLRRLEFDPGYFLTQQPQSDWPEALRSLFAERQEWLEANVSASQRRERHLALARIRAELAASTNALREEWMARRAAVVRRAKIEAWLGSREYPFVLFPEKFLHDRLLAFFAEKP